MKVFSFSIYYQQKYFKFQLIFQLKPFLTYQKLKEQDIIKISELSLELLKIFFLGSFCT